MTHLGGAAPIFWPPAIEGLLQALLLLPAIGLVYVVGVARVLGPRMVLRRSLQYTLATRTLTLLTMLPAIALVSLLRDPDARIRDVLTSVYLALLAVSIAAFVQSRARAPVARRAVLPRGVRCAQDPAVAFEPCALRNRPERSGQPRRPAGRRGAPSRAGGDPRGGPRRRAARCGGREWRSDRPVAGRRRAGLDAPLVGRAARDRADRRAIAAAAAAARGAGLAGTHTRGAAGAGARREPVARRRTRARREAVGRGLHGGGSRPAREHRRADGPRLRRRQAPEAPRRRGPRRFGRRRAHDPPGDSPRLPDVPVCGAIETAHRQGVLHRDLKPENILLPPGDITAKVLDFGVAKVIAPERHGLETAPAEAATALTVDGAIVGTPAYMVPEQLRGHTPDARTDVFSLGVIAYEMLTGDLPFGRGSLAEVVLAQARGVPPDGLHALPPPFTRAVGAALELDADRRLPSPQAFAHLLGAAEGL